MKHKLSRIMHPELINAVQRLRTTDKIPGVKAWKLSKSTKALGEHIENAESIRKKICEKLCEKDKEGKPVMRNFVNGTGGFQQEYSFTEANRREFEKEFKQLMEEEVDVPDPEVKLSEILPDPEVDKDPKMRFSISIAEIEQLVGVVLIDA